MPKKLYKCTVVKSGYVAGESHEKGETLELTERQRDTGLRRTKSEDYSLEIKVGGVVKNDPLGE